jgi:hypothetical protein
MKYSHAVSFNIEIESDNEFPNGQELYQAFKKAILELDEFNTDDKFEVFDTIEIEEN